MAQPTIVGESGRVNGKMASTPATAGGGGGPKAAPTPSTPGPKAAPTPSTPGAKAAPTPSTPGAKAAPSRRLSKTHGEASTKSNRKTSAHARRGAPIPRRFTEVGSDPFDSVVWERRTS